ncbi:hypothetical protein J2S49_001034 [Arcanobacterium wilhelmae]|uniref:ABC transporter permease n=1 Tax=Arcanobacterium wilhelmae TaxID=1803177 RepID=A0ABT9NBT6_9ACTO|nr:hypothetical protein [Arcanobacterium wilhelmae]MDP9800958.1 hypothetical protein [Arcanobacterium wilhelmae]WFN90318.1 hypothetical protein P8A24_00210 [Arcanobacterium wilhelmae]
MKLIRLHTKKWLLWIVALIVGFVLAVLLMWSLDDYSPDSIPWITQESPAPSLLFFGSTRLIIIGGYMGAIWAGQYTYMTRAHFAAGATRKESFRCVVTIAALTLAIVTAAVGALWAAAAHFDHLRLDGVSPSTLAFNVALVAFLWLVGITLGYAFLRWGWLRTTAGLVVATLATTLAIAVMILVRYLATGEAMWDISATFTAAGLTGPGPWTLVLLAGSASAVAASWAIVRRMPVRWP